MYECLRSFVWKNIIERNFCLYHGGFLSSLGFQLQRNEEEHGLEDDVSGVDLDDFALILGESNSFQEIPEEDQHLLTRNENLNENLSVVTQSNSQVDNNNTKVVFYPNSNLMHNYYLQTNDYLFIFLYKASSCGQQDCLEFPSTAATCSEVNPMQNMSGSSNSLENESHIQ